MSRLSRLYHGESNVDFVGRRRLWFAISAAVLAISIASLFFPGLNFGIDFKGGAVFRARPTRPVTEAQVRQALGTVAKVVQVTSNQPVEVIVQTEPLSQPQVSKVRADLARVTGVSQVDTDVVGPKWGSTVSRKAVIALLLFLGVTVVYVSLRFEFKMAVAAIVAVLHDLITTAGIYALARFEVSPATVIALLTILGYSLYDTVVVFDKVRENTGELTSMSRVTYSDAANRAINQTVVRSLNTSLTSLLPIGALLFVGAFLLGAQTLKDLALALFVGVTASSYSSIFVAAPLVAAWKEREPRYQQLRARVVRLAQSPAAPEAVGAKAAKRVPARPARPAAGARRGGPAVASRPRGREAAWDAEEQAEELMPELAPDPEEPQPAADAVPEDAAAAGAPEPVPTPAARPSQKPRPAQQRRKRGARQPSRSAKRRRR